MDPVSAYLVAPNDSLHSKMIIDGLGVGSSAADGAAQVECRQRQRVGLYRCQIGWAHIRVAAEIRVPGLYKRRKIR